MEYDKKFFYCQKLLPNFYEKLPVLNHDYGVVIRYFQKIHKNIQRMPVKTNPNIFLSAYYDAVGG